MNSWTLRQHRAAPQRDMEALWRRVGFNVLISNTDDHLRNHAFLYDGPNGWRLSSAYDLNPVPQQGLTKQDIDRMASAFEHQDLARAASSRRDRRLALRRPVGPVNRLLTETCPSAHPKMIEWRRHEA